MPIAKNKLRWMDREIAVHMLKEKPRAVIASCLGPLAIHEAVTRDWVYKYTLTHISTGHAVLHMNSKAELKKVALYLARRFGHIFCLTDASAIFSKTPPAIRAWIGDCKRQGRWTEPPDLSATQPQ